MDEDIPLPFDPPAVARKKGHVKRYPPPPLRYGGGSISAEMMMATMI
jgi:hypothetical protein